MSWWDGSMKNQTNRTLLQWKFQGGKDNKRRELFGPRLGEARRERPTRAHQRKVNAERSRLLAERFEGISSRHDSSDFVGPFSRATLWSQIEMWRGRR